MKQFETLHVRAVAYLRHLQLAHRLRENRAGGVTAAFEEHDSEPGEESMTERTTQDMTTDRKQATGDKQKERPTEEKPERTGENKSRDESQREGDQD